MSKSYNGGSTVIKTRNKSWYAMKAKQKKRNNEIENERLRSTDKDLLDNFQSERYLIKKKIDD